MSSRLENNKLTLGNVEITSDLLIPSFTFQSVNITNASTSIHLNIDEGYEYVVFKDGNIIDINIFENVTLEAGKYVIVGLYGKVYNSPVINTNNGYLNLPNFSESYKNNFLNIPTFFESYKNNFLNIPIFSESYKNNFLNIPTFTEEAINA